MHVVVDGSNLATEGRTLPSLKQLIEGVLDFRGENPEAEVVVVVDATFGHRIDDSERPLFEDAIVHQEIVSPPAGAIGRGDAFVLRIAEKVGATVLSNDSFQEFHAEHEWLFDQGRLIGGKPVPGIGWIFTPRTPVRGPRSREATQEAKRKQRKAEISSEAPLVSGAELVEKGKAALDKLPKGRREKAKKDDSKGREPKKDEHKRSEAKADGPEQEASSGPRRNRRSRGPVQDAIALATVEAVVPDPEDDGGGGGKRRKRRRKAAPLGEPVNEPGVFLELVAAYRPGDLVEGEVEQFSSHGAFITVQGARCYIPLTLLGDPAPRAARDVLKRGEVRTFVLRAFDAARRGVELALPGIDLPVGPVADETAAAAVGAEAPDESDELAPDIAAGRPADEAAPVEAAEAPSRPRRAKKAAAAAAAELTPSRPRRAKPAVAAVTDDTVVDEAPSRPRRAKKAAAAAEAELAAKAPRRTKKAAAAAPPAEAPASPVDAAVEAAPRRRVKKAAASEAAAPPRRAKRSPTAPADEAAPPAGLGPEPTRPARAPRKKAAAAAATPPPEAALLPAAEAAPPEAAAAAPRKRKKKVAAPPEVAPAIGPDAPRARGSRKAKPAVERPAATMAGDAQPQEAEPVPAAPARKRAVKKAVPPAAVPNPEGLEPPVPPAKTPAKRQRTKKAPPP